MRIESTLVRHRYFGDGALKHLADVLPFGAARAGLRSPWIRRRRQALAVEREDALAVAIERHAGWIPSRWYETAYFAGASRRDIDDGQRVVVGICHEQRLAVGRQGQSIRRRSWRC